MSFVINVLVHILCLEVRGLSSLPTHFASAVAPDIRKFRAGLVIQLTSAEALRVPYAWMLHRNATCSPHEGGAGSSAAHILQSLFPEEFASRRYLHETARQAMGRINP